MPRLTISDLARSEQLDRPTMAAVRGGWKTALPSPVTGEPGVVGKADATLMASENAAPLQEMTGTACPSGSGQHGEDKILQRSRHLGPT